MSHKVVRDCFKKVIDGWTYQQALNVLDGQYDGEVGYNPGSQMIQIAGIGILNAVDHYIKEVLHIEYYIRYMDDFVLIHHDKEYLLECKAKLAQIVEQLAAADGVGLELVYDNEETIGNLIEAAVNEMQSSAVKIELGVEDTGLPSELE